MKNLLIRDIILEKCPNCGQGDVFEKKNKWINLPVTKKKCSNCHLRFEKEPGFFIGSMYVSYGLAVFEGIVTFIITKLLFLELSIIQFFIPIVFIIVLLSVKNFKWARIIYIRIFLGQKKDSFLE
jgi:uncharacterized protein (DUF983 family)